MPIFTLPWEVHSTKHTRLTSGMDDSTIWDQVISRFYGHQETNDIETGGQDHCAKNVCNVTESSRVESRGLVHVRGKESERSHASGDQRAVTSRRHRRSNLFLSTLYDRRHRRPAETFWTRSLPITTPRARLGRWSSIGSLGGCFLVVNLQRLFLWFNGSFVFVCISFCFVIEFHWINWGQVSRRRIVLHTLEVCGQSRGGGRSQGLTCRSHGFRHNVQY
jgi:hypothetical protein